MNILSPTSLRRFQSTPPRAPLIPRAGSAYLVEGRTKFPSTVVDVSESPRVLVDGHNNRKIGRKVVKGPWSGLPIFTLTLEERATCPRSCEVWDTCYGNGMHWSRRHRHGPELEARVCSEVNDLANTHRKGFVVRLHVLGDFYSVEYAGLWLGLLAKHDNLFMFGYTARIGCEIAAVVAKMNDIFPERCFIRTSQAEIGYGASIVVDSVDEAGAAIVCPAQTEKTECCGTCALCWAPAARHRTIAFLRHGNAHGGRAPNLKRERFVMAAEDSGWIELSPWTLKKTEEPRVTIRAACMGKHKAPIVYIGINRPLLDGLKWDTSGKSLAKIDVGSGANAGKVRIAQSPKGRFRLAASGRAGTKNGVRIVVRLPNQAPGQSRPQIIDHKVSADGLVIDLPKQWADLVQVVPYSKSSEAVVTKSAPPAELTQTVVSPQAVLVEVKPDVARMLEESGRYKKVEPSVAMSMTGRYLMIGKTPVTLMADEVGLMKVLIDRFGEVVTNGTLKSLEPNPNVTLTRIKQKIKGSKATLLQRSNGWMLVNADSPLLALDGDGK